MSQTETPSEPPVSTGLSWRVRVVLLVFTALAVTVVWFTNQFLTERYTISTKNRSEVRQALYAGNLLSELQRNSVVPLLLSRDPALIGALNSDDYSQSSQRLISVKDEIGAASLMMMDESGRAVAATDRTLIGSTHRSSVHFISALRSN